MITTIFSANDLRRAQWAHNHPEAVRWKSALYTPRSDFRLVLQVLKKWERLSPAEQLKVNLGGVDIIWAEEWQRVGVPVGIG